MFKDDSAAVVEEKQEATPEAAPATEEVAAPAAEESKQEEVDAPVAEAVVASEVETQPAQPVSLKKRKFKKKQKKKNPDMFSGVVKTVALEWRSLPVCRHLEYFTPYQGRLPFIKIRSIATNNFMECNSNSLQFFQSFV